MLNPSGVIGMRTVKEVSKLTGVSIRTLHHYDAIGLLRPAGVTEAGYRLYDDAALRRLQTILLFRELRFPLKEIQKILDHPGFDRHEALSEQIRLLELQRERLDAVIAHAREIQKKGECDMDFSAFDNKKLESYAAQAKEKWGGTDAYREFEEKTRGQSTRQMRDKGEELMEYFVRLGALRDLPADHEQTQTWAADLQKFITDHYYTCTKEILRSLGMMYAGGGEMTENIDHAGGAGTGAFAQQVIEIYCEKQQ